MRNPRIRKKSKSKKTLKQSQYQIVNIGNCKNPCKSYRIPRKQSLNSNIDRNLAGKGFPQSSTTINNMYYQMPGLSQNLAGEMLRTGYLHNPINQQGQPYRPAFSSNRPPNFSIRPEVSTASRGYRLGHGLPNQNRRVSTGSQTLPTLRQPRSLRNSPAITSLVSSSNNAGVSDGGIGILERQIANRERRAQDERNYREGLIRQNFPRATPRQVARLVNLPYGGRSLDRSPRSAPATVYQHQLQTPPSPFPLSNTGASEVSNEPLSFEALNPIQTKGGAGAGASGAGVPPSRRVLINPLSSDADLGLISGRGVQSLNIRRRGESQYQQNQRVQLSGRGNLIASSAPIIQAERAATGEEEKEAEVRIEANLRANDLPPADSPTSRFPVAQGYLANLPANQNPNVGIVNPDLGASNIIGPDISSQESGEVDTGDL